MPAANMLKGKILVILQKGWQILSGGGGAFRVLESVLGEITKIAKISTQ